MEETSMNGNKEKNIDEEKCGWSSVWMTNANLNSINVKYKLMKDCIGGIMNGRSTISIG